MGQAPSMETPTSLTSYTDARNSSTCDDMISMEECQSVVLDSKWHDWYWADVMYAQSAIYFYASGIGLFIVFNIWFHIRHKLKRSWARAIINDPIQLWTSALGRYLSNRQFLINRTFGYTLTLGETLIVSAMILFFAAMTLGPQPYYWPNPIDYGYSPPIATRAGFLAVAILPFQVMFAAKWNPITILTGVSHERLQVYHRWSGWIMYVLALIHAFPFIIVDIQTGVMMETWRTDFYTYSGVICLFPQTVLVLFSIAAIRDRWYETFKSVHFIMAAWFIVLLFLHCGFTLTSAYYFIGFAVTYTLSVIIRWSRSFLNGLSHRATVELVDDKMILITIPTNLYWKAGQHYFFRFITPNIHALTSHPFTVASMPTPTPSDTALRVQGRVMANVMTLYLNKRSGMTNDLFNRAVDQGSVKVYIDGPYGGIGSDMGKYDRVLLIGGGSGGSFILSALEDLGIRQNKISCRDVTIVYACRHLSDASWFRKPIFKAASALRFKVQVHFHVSSVDPTVIQDEKTGDRLELTDSPLKDDSPLTSNLNVNQTDLDRGPLPCPDDDTLEIQDLGLIQATELNHLLPGRPNVDHIVKNQTSKRGTVGIVVCGPKEMVYDVRNAVAEVQLGIVKGSVKCEECYLHTEVFGW